MAWIESHQSLLTHRKTLRAAALLKVDRYKLIGHLHALWWWAVDNVPYDGSLAGIGDEEIAAAAGWNGRGLFAESLRDAGFLDTDSLHDWEEYAGKLAEQRELRKESNRKAQSARRQRLRQQAVSADTADSQQSTVPNRTQPNQQDRTDQAAAAMRAYEDNIGQLNPATAQLIDEAVAEYGETCVVHCIEEANECNAKSWKYAAAIMRRHQSEGCYGDADDDPNDPYSDAGLERRFGGAVEGDAPVLREVPRRAV